MDKYPYAVARSEGIGVYRPTGHGVGVCTLLLRRWRECSMWNTAHAVSPRSDQMPDAIGHARDGSTFPIHSYAYGLPAHHAGTGKSVRLMIDKALGRAHEMEDAAHSSEGAQNPAVRDFALAAVASPPRPR